LFNRIRGSPCSPSNGSFALVLLVSTSPHLERPPPSLRRFAKCGKTHRAIGPFASTVR
jgi:hypothetical protein